MLTSFDQDLTDMIDHLAFLRDQMLQERFTVSATLLRRAQALLEEARYGPPVAAENNTDDIPPF